MRSLPTVAVLVAALAFGPLAAAPASAAPLDALDFLAGEWEGSGGGKPGEATRGGTTFARELDGKVLVRRNFAEYPPAAGGKQPRRHDDLMVIYSEGDALKATYWDSEGHVIRYTVTASKDGARFTSEPGPGPSFQLDYTRKGDALSLAFAVAGKPYVSATLTRKK